VAAGTSVFSIRGDIMKAAVIGGTGGQGIALTFKEPENRDINIY
jgi:hypothetical protein